MNRAERLARLYRGVNGFKPIELIPANPESLPNPSSEAHHLFGLIRRGSTVEELRALIDVTPRQAAFLRRITEGDVLRRRMVERMLVFRTDVRTCFEAELVDPELGKSIPVE